MKRAVNGISVFCIRFCSDATGETVRLATRLYSITHEVTGLRFVQCHPFESMLRHH
jgi:hypothetical protein